MKNHNKKLKYFLPLLVTWVSFDIIVYLASPTTIRTEKNSQLNKSKRQQIMAGESLQQRPVIVVRVLLSPAHTKPIDFKSG